MMQLNPLNFAKKCIFVHVFDSIIKINYHVRSTCLTKNSKYCGKNA
jgi:hypothetical protein